MTKKKGTKTVSQLKKKAWVVFSKWIRKRDKYICFTCGTSYTPEEAYKIHAGHFITRSHNSTLFNERNVNAQCYACNIMKRGNAGVYAFRLMKKYGDGVVGELVKESQKIKQFTPKELEEIIQKYVQSS